MSISRNMTSLTGAALAATAGAMVITNTPSLRLVAHADETHDQNVSVDPSVGDNSVNDPTKVSTIDDAYRDVQGDTARDTNQAQHSSIGWEYQDPNQAADSWKTPDDTKVEPGTDNTQTDWNIATGTNGKSASDTSYDVTGDSSENKFNPGNINLYGASAVADKSASVRENWPAIEKANMAYDDFMAQYGSYWGPVYWGSYTHGVGYPTAYGYYGYPGTVVSGGGTTVVNNNNNNNNSSNNNNGLSSLNGLATNLMATNGLLGGGNGGNGGNGGSNGVVGQQGQQGQQQSSSGSNSSSSSSSANSQTTVLPGGAVVPGVVGGYGYGGFGVVSNNNNNNNNNNSSNNNNALSNLSNLSNLSSLASNTGNSGSGAGNGNNGGNNGNSDNGNGADTNTAHTDKADKKASKAKNATEEPAKDKTANVSATDNGAQTPATDADATATTGSGDSTGETASAAPVVSAVSSDAGSGAGSASVGSASSTGLPQTGNLHVEKASVTGFGLIAATLVGMGVAKKRKNIEQ